MIHKIVRQHDTCIFRNFYAVICRNFNEKRNYDFEELTDGRKDVLVIDSADYDMVQIL